MSSIVSPIGLVPILMIVTCIETPAQPASFDLADSGTDYAIVRNVDTVERTARDIWFQSNDESFRIGYIAPPTGRRYTLELSPVMPEWSDYRDAYAYRIGYPFEGVTTYIGHIRYPSNQGPPRGLDPGSSVLVVYRGPMMFGLVTQSDGYSWVFKRNLYEPTYASWRVDVEGVVDRNHFPDPLRDTSDARTWRSNKHPAPCVWSHGNNAIGYEFSTTWTRLSGLYTTYTIKPDSGTSDWASHGVQGFFPKPEIIAPADGDTVIAGEKVTFLWRNPCEEYAVYTDENPATSSAVKALSRTYRDTGTHFWTVTAFAKANRRRAHSRGRYLHVIAPPAAVRDSTEPHPHLRLEHPADGDTVEVGVIRLTWSTTSSGPIDLEVRGSAEHSVRVDSATHHRLQLDPGIYWWRGRMVDSSGNRPWVGWQEFVVTAPDTVSGERERIE